GLRRRPRRRPHDPRRREVGALSHPLRLPARLGRRGPRAAQPVGLGSPQRLEGPRDRQGRGGHAGSPRRRQVHRVRRVLRGRVDADPLGAGMTLERRGTLQAGFDALRHGKLVLLLTGLTALLGLIGAMPLAPSFQKDLAGTLAGDHFIRNAPTLAPADDFDIIRFRRDVLRGADRTAGLVGLLAVLQQTLIAGGIVVVLGRGRFSFSQFVEPARRNLWHNVKCLLLFVAALALVLGGWFAGTIAASHRLLENVPPDSAARTAIHWAILLVGLLLVGILSLAYDFARAARRYAPTIGAWRSVRFAGRVLRESWIAALLLFGFWLGLGALAVAAGVGAAWFLPAVSLPAVL